MSIVYPYSRPEVTDEDVAAIVEAARSQYLTQGDRVVQFEAGLANRFGADHAIVCNSGTAALHMVYAGLDAGPDAGVISSAVTFLATANAARMCGAPVAFADVDPVSGLVTPETLEAALRAAKFPVRIAAVVHLGGRVCDMAGLQAVAERHGCLLVEDACHAPGATYQVDGATYAVGSCGHSAAAAFSFHAIKHVTMGEGGAVLTNDREVDRRARILRSHGMLRDAADQLSRPEDDAPWYYEMHEIGWNYRADEIACSLGLSQLGRLDAGLLRRRELSALYGRLLSDIPHLIPPVIPNDGGSNAWHLYPVAIDFQAVGKSRGKVMRELADAGVGSQVHYIPLHLQPYYRGMAPVKLPGAERYYDRTLSLPLYPQLTEDDVVKIAAVVRTVLLVR